MQGDDPPFDLASSRAPRFSGGLESRVWTFPAATQPCTVTAGPGLWGTPLFSEAIYWAIFSACCVVRLFGINLNAGVDSNGHTYAKVKFASGFFFFHRYRHPPLRAETNFCHLTHLPPRLLSYSGACWTGYSLRHQTTTMSPISHAPRISRSWISRSRSLPSRCLAENCRRTPSTSTLG